MDTLDMELLDKSYDDAYFQSLISWLDEDEIGVVGNTSCVSAGQPFVCMAGGLCVTEWGNPPLSLALYGDASGDIQEKGGR